MRIRSDNHSNKSIRDAWDRSEIVITSEDASRKIQRNGVGRKCASCESVGADQ